MTCKFNNDLYLWCHQAGVYNTLPGIPGPSHCSPVEAAERFGIENIIFVTYGGAPRPPFDAQQREFAGFSGVVWSIAGDCASSYESPDADLAEILRLRSRYSNVSGGILDDFFADGRQFDLAGISRRMHEAGLPLWVVLYTKDLHRTEIWEQLESCDIISLWTWDAADLVDLEDHLAVVRKKLPDKEIALGIYFWDFCKECECPEHLMRHQCRVAAEYYRTGKIQKIIVLGSPLVGMGLAAEAIVSDFLAEMRLPHEHSGSGDRNDNRVPSVKVSRITN